MSDNPFIKGQIYKRSTIHKEFGGSGWGGIAYSGSYPYIFIFSGDTGKQHGYEDRWINDNVFQYTGQGQTGDMTFIQGNLQLRDHLERGKRVFLFIYVKKGWVQFNDEMELIDLGYFLGPDKEGKERRAIRFFFKRIGKRLDYPVPSPEQLEVKKKEADYVVGIPTITEREGLVTSRVGQGAYRKSILYRWEFKCAVTGYLKKEILVASHIVPWKSATNDERLNVDNGILLSPTYDALFDRNLISFENSGHIILSDSLKKSEYTLIGVTGKERIKKLSSGNLPFLERHRENLI